MTYIPLYRVKPNQQIAIEGKGFGIVKKIVGDPCFIGCGILFSKFCNGKEKFTNKLITLENEKVYILN